jgi:tetratricopeptide (TPR) repeat protein
LQLSVAGIYAAMRQFDRAVEHTRKALELNPNYPAAQLYLGVYQTLMGKLDEGIRACEMAALLLGRHPLSLATLGLAYASAGRTSDVQKLAEELRGLAEKTYVANIYFAVICLSLGEIEKGLDWAEKAVDEYETTIAFFLCLWVFDPVRSHPRYRALLRKMNLEP